MKPLRPGALFQARPLAAQAGAVAAALLLGLSGASRAQPLATVEQTLQRQAAMDMELRCPGNPGSGPMRLSEVVLRGLCADPKTRVSWAAVRAQQADVLLRRAARRPTATAQLELGRATERERAEDGTRTRLGGRTSALGAQMQWVLWDFGLQDSRENATEQAMMAAAASHDQTLQQTLIKLVQTYLAVAEAQVLVDITREAERFTRHLLLESMRPAKGGKSTLDVLGEKQARTALWSQALDLRRAEGQLARARGELSVLLGLPVQTAVVVEAPAARPGSVVSDPSLIPMLEAALQAYPPLREAQARLAVARAELNEAERSDLPVLLAGAGQQRARTASVPSRTEHNVGLRLEIPLSSWADRRHRIQRAQAQVDAASQAYRQTRKEVEVEVWLTYQDLRENVSALQMAERFRLSADDLLKAELRAFRAGDSDMFDVLDANNSKMEASKAEVASLSALNLARSRLAASLGQLARLQLPPELVD